jgi:ABC-2 type transport system ATP-binding protein
VFGLLGPNGAGKSTIVKILTTLSRPNAGTARVAGYDVLREARLVRRVVGVVTQKSGVDLEATGRENLTLQGRLHGLTGAGLARRVRDLMERFDLDAAADRVTRTYSGGMLRRLDVAVGLVHRPTVLFLDEPTTGLDPQARAAMWAEIAELTTEGLTILLTTHYLEEADKLAARIAIVEGGRIVVEGSPDELKSELRGDAVDLTLAAAPGAPDAEALRTRLLGVPGVNEATVDGREVRTRVVDGASALPAVLAAVEGSSLTVTAATISRPSLDDVYLRHVGHRFGAGSGYPGGDSRQEVA